jgi:hypothetical protein
LFEAWGLEIPVKRKWWAVIDLMLAPQADTGKGRSSNTKHKALSVSSPAVLNSMSIP